jgi:hypothetical protein
MSAVIVKLKNGKDLRIIKANSPDSAERLRADIARWMKMDTLISFATHNGLRDVRSQDIESVEVRQLERSASYPV